MINLKTKTLCFKLSAKRIAYQKNQTNYQLEQWASTTSLHIFTIKKVFFKKNHAIEKYNTAQSVVITNIREQRSANYASMTMSSYLCLTSMANKRWDAQTNAQQAFEKSWISMASRTAKHAPFQIAIRAKQSDSRMFPSLKSVSIAMEAMF